MNQIMEFENGEVLIKMNKHCLSFDDVLSTIMRYKKKYDFYLRKSGKSSFTSDNSKFDIEEIIKEKQNQKQIIKDIILKVLEKYHILKEKKLCIFLFGSLACGTNRIDSDIDLSFIYDDVDFLNLFPVEEQICYILSQIFGLYRDQIHTMMHYAIDEKEKYLSYLEGIQFAISWNSSQKCTYCCRKNRESLLYKVHHCSRDFKTIQQYLLSNITKDKCVDWVVKFEEIFNTSTFKINEFIHVLESKITSEKKDILKFCGEIDNIIQNINEHVLGKIHEIGEFKKYFKDDISKLLNKFFNVSRRFKLMRFEETELIDYSIYFKNLKTFDFFKENELKKLQMTYIEHIQKISFLSYQLNKNKINFSHHNTQSLENALFLIKIDKLFLRSVIKLRKSFLIQLQSMNNVLREKINE